MKWLILAAVMVAAFSSGAGAQSYQVVFICPQSFSSALAPLISDAETDGWQANLLTIEYIESHYAGADRREKIKAAVADLHDHGLEIVCFVGDADYSGTEPQYDIIPLWYFYCPEIGYWRDDRATMIDYVDIDGDRIPDVAWTWIPANDAQQVSNLVSHSLYYKSVDSGEAWLKKCLWLVEDEDLEGNSGAITRELADSLINDPLLSRFNKKTFYDSDIAFGYFNRQDSAVTAIDAGVGAVFGMGTVANRTDFVEFMSGYFYFSVSGDLAANSKCGVYVGLSCGLGEFDRPINPSRGLDFCSQFLFDNQNKGASFWIGPSGNTRYFSNYYFGKALIEQLFTLGARTTAEACYMALRRVMIEHPEFAEVWEGHNFFGSPFHVMHGMRELAYSDADITPQYKWELKQNYPNPFNPATSIGYSVARKEHVRISIYDVSGRRVKVLVNEVQDTGSKRITWDGSNDKGRKMASGVYFCLMKTPSHAMSRKIILMR